MENTIKITWLNDFIFCPISIYYHNLYGNMEKQLYQSTDQINGKQAHETIDSSTYRSSQKSLCGIDVYCEEYNLSGKIDIYYPQSGKLVERKKHITTIYDGYIFQIYAQYFAMSEMGYEIKQLCFHSIDDNKTYYVSLPEDDKEMFNKFLSIIQSINSFSLNEFVQTNPQKCDRCIYEPLCDRRV